MIQQVSIGGALRFYTSAKFLMNTCCTGLRTVLVTKYSQCNGDHEKKNKINKRESDWDFHCGDYGYLWSDNWAKQVGDLS